MAVGILDRKPFRRGGGVEFGIGREQRQRRVSCMDFQGRRELHTIILPRQERSSQTGNHGTTPPYGRELPPGRTRKGEDDWGFSDRH